MTATDTKAILVTDLAELIQRQYEGGAPSAAAGLEDIDYEELVCAAYAALAVQRHQQQSQQGTAYVDQAFVSTKMLAVKHDPKTDRHYADLPDAVVELAFGRGVRAVYPPQDPENPYPPLPPGSSFRHKHTPRNRSTYKIDADGRMWYDRKHNPDCCELACEAVWLHPLVVSADLQFPIRDYVLKHLLPERGVAQDKLNDQNPNIQRALDGK